MKKSWFSLLTLAIVASGLFSFYHISHSDENTEPTGRIMAFREITLREGANPAEWERFAARQLTPTFKQYVPGVESYVLKGDRGDNQGNYVHLLIFDSERTRDFYFPSEGESGIPEEAMPLWEPVQVIIQDSLTKYIEPLATQQGYTDYIFLE